VVVDRLRFCTIFYLYNLYCACYAGHVMTRRFSSQTYCFRIIVVVSARDLSPLPFRDDYRNSLTSHPSGAQDNEKTRIHTDTHTHETTHAGGCSVRSRTAVLCIRLLPPPPLLRGGFSGRHFRPEIQM